MTIAIDLLSAWNLPTTAAGWTTLLAGTGLANPTSAWGHQEASGHFVDTIGSNTSTSETGLNYAVTVPNTSRKGVKCTSAGGAGKVLVPCLITNAHSQTLVQVFSIGSIPAGTAQALNCIGATQFEEAQLSLSRQIVGHSGGAIATGTIAENSIVIVVTKYDHTNSIFAVYTSTGQTLKPTYTAQGADVTTFLVGDGSNSSDSVCLFSAMFQDAAAEISDANVAVLMGKMRGASTVTRDAASGMWWPRKPSEWTTLLGSRLTALPSPSMAYGWQDINTPLVDDYATDNLTVSGGTLTSPVTGSSRLAWQTGDGTGNSVLTGGTYGGSQSTMSLCLADILATTTIQRTFVYHNQTWVDVQANTGKLITIANSLGNNVSANVYAGAGVFPLVLRDNITAPFVRMNTPSEQVNCGATANGANRFYYGGVINQTISSEILGAAHWLNANAEYTDAMTLMLLDAITNGPAATAIAISPSAYTLATVGATQQMASITTVADGSNYASTTNVTWASSNPSAATVNAATGLVTAVANGTTNITASYTSLGAATVTSGAVVVTVNLAGGSPVINPGASVRATTVDPTTVLGVGIWR